MALEKFSSSQQQPEVVRPPLRKEEVPVIHSNPVEDKFEEALKEFERASDPKLIEENAQKMARELREGVSPEKAEQNAVREIKKSMLSEEGKHAISLELERKLLTEKMEEFFTRDGFKVRLIPDGGFKVYKETLGGGEDAAFLQRLKSSLLQSPANNDPRRSILVAKVFPYPNKQDIGHWAMSTSRDIRDRPNSSIRKELEKIMLLIQEKLQVEIQQLGGGWNVQVGPILGDSSEHDLGQDLDPEESRVAISQSARVFW